LISIPAGVCGMALPQFLLYSAIGTALWTTLLVYIGSLLGENYHAVARYVGPVSYVVFAALIGAFVLRLIRRWR
jgi:membrane protein DedA with SNARE-associated domain